MTFFNAGGEPFCWDPIRDRTRNAHLTLLGPSGSGKSAILNYMLASMMWAHKPRLFIIDMKWPYPSFGLLVDYFQSQGLSVNRIRLMPNDAQALPPFRDAMRLLDDRGQPIADATETDTDDGSEQRDLLGEMVLLAETMVTGGDASARRKFTRPDRLLLSQAILHAAKSVFGRQEYPLTEHVVEALRDLANQGAEGIDPPRARWMAANLQYYTVGLAGQLFNRYGDPFPEADVTLIEPAVIGQEGHQDELTVAFMAILQNIQAVITRDASDNRQTIVLADEKHVVAANPYLGPYTVKIVKVWRSAGTWYWQATQDLEDYTESMRPLINNSDWFIGMSMEKEQLQQLRAFKSLTDEQIGLIEQCRIDPGNYAEGTLIHRNFSSIFRAVLPPLSLALAQSEREERAHRYDLMKRYGYKTQLEAALHVAREIERARSQNVQEDTTEAPR
ncbi:MAG: FtsK/SpoIIIE domain-containing protein [Pseudomonadota bacterium]